MLPGGLIRPRRGGCGVVTGESGWGYLVETKDLEAIGIAARVPPRGWARSRSGLPHNSRRGKRAPEPRRRGRPVRYSSSGAATAWAVRQLGIRASWRYEEP